MITSARPITSEKAHWYQQDGIPVFYVPNISCPGHMRPTTLKDARKLGLLPSPTGITKLLHRHSLVQWLIEQAVLAAITAPKHADEPLDDFVKRVIQVDKDQDQERDAAAKKGQAIHAAIRRALNADDYPRDLSVFVNPVIGAVQNLGRPVDTEKIIVGNGYAGTTDLIAENPEEVWVIDYKASKNIPDKPYLEHKLQLGAYAGGLGNTGDKRIRCANIYISTSTPGVIQVSEIEDWQKDYKAFRCLLDFYKIVNNL